MFPVVVVSEITRVQAFQIQDKMLPLDRKPLDGELVEGVGEEAAKRRLRKTTSHLSTQTVQPYRRRWHGQRIHDNLGGD